MSVWNRLFYYCLYILLVHDFFSYSDIIRARVCLFICTYCWVCFCTALNIRARVCLYFPSREQSSCIDGTQRLLRSQFFLYFSSIGCIYNHVFLFLNLVTNWFTFSRYFLFVTCNPLQSMSARSIYCVPHCAESHWIAPQLPICVCVCVCVCARARACTKVTCGFCWICKAQHAAHGVATKRWQVFIFRFSFCPHMIVVNEALLSVCHTF